MTAPRFRIVMSVESAFSKLAKRRPLTALARRTLESEGVVAPAEVSIAITDDARVRELNQRYRGLDAPTDVLSFGLGDDDDFVSPPNSARQLGDIVISYPTAVRQADEAHHSIDEELAHLLVHGLLHLLGYDHELPKEARLMRAREEALLGHAAH